MHICFALVAWRGASPLRQLAASDSENWFRLFAYGFDLAMSKDLMRCRMMRGRPKGRLVVPGASVSQVGEHRC